MINIFWNKPVLSRYRITEALATLLKIPKSLDGRLMLRSFSRKFQPKTDLRLRFEVAQSFRLDGQNKLSLAIYPSLRSNLALFIFAPFFITFKPYISPVRLKRWLTCHGLVVSTLGSALLNTGFCLCSCKGTYVLQARAPKSQPLSSVCVMLFPS